MRDLALACKELTLKEKAVKSKTDILKLKKGKNFRVYARIISKRVCAKELKT